MSSIKQLIFATNNNHKLTELRAAVNKSFILKSLSDIGFNEDIPEPFDTLEDNALAKVRYLHESYKINCFADDTGLEIEALNGAPGVFSARFAGDQKDSEANMQKVLDLLHGVDNRKARFRTVIALNYDNKEYLFEGVVNGKIIKERTGDMGFGYDPIFVPDGFDTTFAQMDIDVKNQISHRGRATAKLIEFLNKL
ncbi:MAG: non-canonical purine NTP diphosphatase [Bacteroidales bacterium]|nr:non-canonical purine NTP diphosphatase [Bacteroidales bacterium]